MTLKELVEKYGFNKKVKSNPNHVSWFIPKRIENDRVIGTSNYFNSDNRLITYYDDWGTTSLKTWELCEKNKPKSHLPSFL